MSYTFQALVVRVSDDKTYTRSIEERSIDDLLQGEVLIRVHYSSLNYKDGLSYIGDRDHFRGSKFFEKILGIRVTGRGTYRISQS